MIRTHYTITLKSYLNHSNGEGDLFVDTDIVTDLVGLPLIRGRAMKGLLRESMEETLERMGKKGNEVSSTINRFFGQGGYERSTNALKFVSNAVISDYEQTFLELYESDFSPHEVKAYYTQILSQTRIDHETGTAQDGSLRFTRVIDFLKQPQLHFYIDSNENLEESELFKSTLLNLRQGGLNRNRGWGSLYVELISREHLLKDRAAYNQIGHTVVTSLKLLSPVLLPRPIGDQNTSYSENCIRGNLLLGALAYRYLDAGNDVDADFLDAFVFGGLIFDHLTKNGAKQLPKILARDKYDAKQTFVNAHHFYQQRSPESERAVLKKTDGFFAENQKVEVNKMFAFHMSRNNDRLAGSSTKKDGAIFYYEYLVPYQIFEGRITETKPGLLNRIIRKTGSKIQLGIGASKSTQYGQVELQIKPLGEKSTQQITKNDPYYLVLESDCLIYNQNGFPSLNLTDFKSYWPDDLELEVLESTKAFSQRFNGQWRSKTPRAQVWAAGSTFLIKGGVEATNFPSRIGEETHTGLGNYSIYSEAEMQVLIKDLNTHQKTEKAESRPNVYVTQMAQNIAENRKKKETEGINEKDALKYIAKTGKVPNSLLHRLKQKLATQEKFAGWIGTIEQKIAGKTLKNAGWYEALLKGKKLTASKFISFQEKWMEIIKQQRFVNKQKGENHESKQ